MQGTLSLSLHTLDAKTYVVRTPMHSDSDADSYQSRGSVSSDDVEARGPLLERQPSAEDQPKRVGRQGINLNTGQLLIQSCVIGQMAPAHSKACLYATWGLIVAGSLIAVVIVLFATGIFKLPNASGSTIASDGGAAPLVATTPLASVAASTSPVSPAPDATSSNTSSTSITSSNSSSSTPAIEVTRTDPPSTFDGTAAGFASLCTVHCNEAKATTHVKWNGTTGSVTRAEIETALGVLSGTTPILANGQGNVFANGVFGQKLDGAEKLFEITGDRRALNIALQLADE